jgi:hypothetical protein
LLDILQLIFTIQFTTKIVWEVTIKPFIKVMPLISEGYAKSLKEAIFDPLLDDIQQEETSVEVDKFFHLLKVFTQKAKYE